MKASQGIVHFGRLSFYFNVYKDKQEHLRLINFFYVPNISFSRYTLREEFFAEINFLEFFFGTFRGN